MKLLPTFAQRGDIAPLLNKIHHCDALELLRRLPDASVDMILTDPPYNVTQAHYESELDLAAYGREFFRVIKPSGAVISTAAQPFTSKLVMAWEKYFRYEWIWRKSRKTNFLNAKRMPLAAHESILVFGHKLPDYYPQMKKGETHVRGWKADRNSKLYNGYGVDMSLSDEFYPDSVLEFSHDADLSITKTQIPSKNVNHPNQKPLTLWEYLVKTYSTEGALVVDCFSGGGTTAVASHNLGRDFIVCDNFFPYVEMARTRLQNTDPFMATVFKDGTKQLSLFETSA